jgi:plastocyanin
MEPQQMRFDIPVFPFVLLVAALSPARADGVTVFQEGKKFSEAEVTVKVGEAVTFSNKDPITHNVYSSTSGMSFDLKTQKAGESTTITFDHAGEAEVHCAIHPQMVMKVKVQ